ncbi:hypothetical protein [Methyloversatilis discipulorum]|uniref:hypothetical protein n=1 Tax=Methyloversatilis discipulorum TaxID=1119528 RepID=UPI003F3C5B12
MSLHVLAGRRVLRLLAIVLCAALLPPSHARMVAFVIDGAITDSICSTRSGEPDAPAELAMHCPWCCSTGGLAPPPSQATVRISPVVLRSLEGSAQAPQAAGPRPTVRARAPPSPDAAHQPQTERARAPDLLSPPRGSEPLFRSPIR